MQDDQAKLECIKGELAQANAVLIGAGAGLSTAAGFTYAGARFETYFHDFEEKYGFHDMYSGGFYPFPTPEEFWAYWSRNIYVNRYDQPAGKPYEDLLRLVRGKNYFVLTTNVDHRFQVAGFEKERLFYTQGDYGLFQCSEPCHQTTYDNEAQIRAMLAAQKDMRIPSSLVPRCPRCGNSMALSLLSTGPSSRTRAGMPRRSAITRLSRRTGAGAFCFSSWAWAAIRRASSSTPSGGWRSETNRRHMSASTSARHLPRARSGGALSAWIRTSPTSFRRCRHKKRAGLLAGKILQFSLVSRGRTLGLVSISRQNGEIKC